MELLLGILASILAAALLFAFKRVRDWGREAWQRLTRVRPSTPRYSIRVLPRSGGCRWQLQERGGKAVASLHASLYATNVIGNPVFLLNTFLKRPRVEGMVQVEGTEDPDLGITPIQPGSTAEVRAYFLLDPALLPEGEDFKAAVVLVDQFGNEHKTKYLLFTAQERAKASPTPTIKRELVHTLADPVEKKVAILLQEEIHQSRTVRSAKQLGSVQFYLPRPQDLIAIGGEKLESEVVDQLESLYSKLPSAEERVKFVRALLSRMRRDSEYGIVGYLSLLFLFKIGKVSDALATAQRELLLSARDQATNDFMWMLDLLLCVYPSHFDSDLLDDVERFLQDGPDWPRYRIQERIARIRVLLVAAEQDPEEGD